MKTIAVLCDVAAEFGGAERYWATVLPQLAQRCAVRLFARRVESPNALGIPAHQIEWADESQLSSTAAPERVARALRGVDAVVTANVLDAAVLEAVRASGARWIARVHDHRPFCPNGNKVFPQFSAPCTKAIGGACYANTLLRGCVRGPHRSSFDLIRRRIQVRDAVAHADAVLVSSGYMRDVCVQNGVRADRVHITPPPLGEAFFAPAGQQHDSTVLYAGRIEEEKGLLSLVRAVATIDERSRPAVTVAGRGSDSYERAVRETADRAHVRMEWLGYLDQPHLVRAMDAARVFALPSLWPEPFGLGATQALARSRPVVAYDVGGVGDWIADPRFAVPRGDERALGSVIDILCNDAHAWQRASAQSREIAERYRLSGHIDRLLSLLDIKVGSHE